MAKANGSADCLKVDLIFHLLSLNHCDHLFVTPPRRCTIAMPKTLTFDGNDKKPIGGAGRSGIFWQEVQIRASLIDWFAEGKAGRIFQLF